MNNKKIEDLFQKKIYKTEEYNCMHSRRLKFPLIVDIEPTNACNMKCVFCSRQVMTRPIRFMPINMCTKIIDEMKDNQPTSIRLSGWGEPTLNKNTSFFIEYANKNGVLNHLTTNGLTMNHQLAKSLLDAGLNKIKFSLQGLDEESYNSMRKCNQNINLYKTVTDNINNFISMRNEGGYNCYIQVSVSILKDENTQKKIDSFYDYWAERVDNVWGLGTEGVYGDSPIITSFNRIENKVSTNLLDKGRNKKKRGCWEPYNKLSIGAEGDIKACCSDFNGELKLGNIRNDTLLSIWNSKRFKTLKDNINSGDINKIPKFCLNCDNYI